MPPPSPTYFKSGKRGYWLEGAELREKAPPPQPHTLTHSFTPQPPPNIEARPSASEAHGAGVRAKGEQAVCSHDPP